MTGFRAGLVAAGIGAAVIGCLLWARPIGQASRPMSLRVRIEPAQLRADGHDTATLTIDLPEDIHPRVTVLTNPHAATIDHIARRGPAWQARIRTGILPGPIAIRVAADHHTPATVSLTALPYRRDRFEDGTPDILRLDDENDRAAFRRWFTYLAELQYFQDAANRPAEIADCAALIRYAYREALHAHDSGWAHDARLTLVPAFDSVRKYQYPYTPFGADLFRTGDGFTQFADAATLRRSNTHLVTRDISRAHPGDLLFFRQRRDHMPYHSMIFLGASRIQDDGNRYVVYHTGPDGGDPGEIRRVDIRELLAWPEPEWRPIAANANFLGVFRWNILRTESEETNVD